MKIADGTLFKGITLPPLKSLLEHVERQEGERRNPASIEQLLDSTRFQLPPPTALQVVKKAVERLFKSVKQAGQLLQFDA